MQHPRAHGATIAEHSADSQGGIALGTVDLIITHTPEQPGWHAHHKPFLAALHVPYGPHQAVANLVFAFGGQFAYLEIMASMAKPRR